LPIKSVGIQFCQDPDDCALCLGGGIGRRKGLKIPRNLVLCRFDSGPRHQKKTAIHILPN
jgi:hypothetical protein